MIFDNDSLQETYKKGLALFADDDFGYKLIEIQKELYEHRTETLTKHLVKSFEAFSDGVSKTPKRKDVQYIRIYQIPIYSFYTKNEVTDYVKIVVDEKNPNYDEKFITILGSNIDISLFVYKLLCFNIQYKHRNTVLLQLFAYSDQFTQKHIPENRTSYFRIDPFSDEEMEVISFPSNICEKKVIGLNELIVGIISDFIISNFNSVLFLMERYKTFEKYINDVKNESIIYVENIDNRKRITFCNMIFDYEITTLVNINEMKGLTREHKKSIILLCLRIITEKTLNLDSIITVDDMLCNMLKTDEAMFEDIYNNVQFETVDYMRHYDCRNNLMNTTILLCYFKWYSSLRPAEKHRLNLITLKEMTKHGVKNKYMCSKIPSDLVLEYVI